MDLSANFILTTGLTVTLLIIWNLLRQRGKAFHKILLALIFALFFLVILGSYGEINDVRIIYAGTFVFADAIGFLIGPLLYLYIKSIYFGKPKLWPVGYLLYGIALVILVNIVLETYSILMHGRLSFNNTMTTLTMVAVTIYLGYYGSGQSRILLPEYLLATTEKQTDKAINHHLSNASEAEVQDLKSRLFEVLEQERPYEGENLNLELLANKIPTTSRKLSALLNHKLETPFYDLINNYRVEAVKEKMSQPQYANYTLLALVYESGFNSKTSFNRIFKNKTGLSPSAYKKQLSIRA